jgi:hypothetical protein
MNARTLATVLLKVWGVILLVNGAIGLVNVLPMAMSSHAGDLRLPMMSAATGALVTVIAGAAVLVGASAIARAIGLNEPGTGDATPAHHDSRELQSLAFGAVAIYLAIGALRDLATIAYTLLRQPAWDQTGALAYLLADRQSDLAGAGVQLVAAAILFVTRSMLAAAWDRARPMQASARDE